jgi:hypothetical protein
MPLPILHSGEGGAEQRVLPSGVVEGAQERLDHGLVEAGVGCDLISEGSAALGGFWDGSQIGISNSTYLHPGLWYRQCHI